MLENSGGAYWLFIYIRVCNKYKTFSLMLNKMSNKSLLNRTAGHFFSIHKSIPV